MENILITGVNGYIGNAFCQRMLNKGNNVVGIDNNSKLSWLKEVNSISAIPIIEDQNERNERLSIFKGKFEFYNINIESDLVELENLFKNNIFDTVVNLGQQPSGPYSQIDLTHASNSIKNNTIGTLNLLFLINKYCPKTHFLEIASTGTFKHDINTDIPENKFQFEFQGRKSEPSLFPRSAGSFYHCSKIFNTYLSDCANRFWDLNITEINQAVVFGSYFNELNKSEMNSHFSFDSCFGTVVNRFIVQSLMNKPLTIFGNGNQQRGFLSLTDSVYCLELLTDNPAEGFRIPNQLSTFYSINEIAEIIKIINPSTKIKYVDNHRHENTDNFYYNIETKVLENLGYFQKRSLKTELNYLFNKIDINNIKMINDNFIKW